MNEAMLLVLDEGTTSTRAMLYTPDGVRVGTAQRDLTQYYPRPGWVEQDATEIWERTLACAQEMVAHAGGADRILAIGITNQRETVVAWDRRSGRPLARAIVWQDRRTADQCQALRDAGLSWRKIEYAKGLAEAELAGTFSADGLAHLSDDEAIAAITQLRGFGRWSAEIYLMFSLQRPDIFPADDLALRVALGRLKGMEDKPTPKQARQLVEPWAPWRSVGSLFLWHYYRGEPV